MSKNLMILGHGRHGKDTVADILKKDFGLNFISSSEFAGRRCVYPALKKDYSYSSFEECFEERHYYRAEWFQLILDYNTPDRTRLGRELFEENDIYVGIRSREEFEALKEAGVLDTVIWVDASKRKPPESSSSMELKAEDADYILDNNGTEEELEKRVHELMISLGYEVKTLEKTS